MSLKIKLHLPIVAGDQKISFVVHSLTHFKEVKLERLSMTFTVNGKMKFPFCQNTEKLDLSELLSCLLTRYIEKVLKRVRQDEKRKFSRFCDTQLPTVCRKRHA